MLVLMRKVGQKIIINGNIEVQVLRTKGCYAQLGIVAPKEISINREEIQQMIDEEKRVREGNIL